MDRLNIAFILISYKFIAQSVLVNHPYGIFYAVQNILHNLELEVNLFVWKLSELSNDRNVFGIKVASIFYINALL